MRTVRVYYYNQDDELVYFEYQCSYQRAYAHLSAVKPRWYRVCCPSSASCRDVPNRGSNTLAERMEIIHPKHADYHHVYGGAQLIVLPSQQERTEHETTTESTV